MRVAYRAPRPASTTATRHTATAAPPRRTVAPAAVRCRPDDRARTQADGGGARSRAPLDGRGTAAVAAMHRGGLRRPGPAAGDRDRLTLRGAGPATVLRLEEGSESPVVVIGDVAHATPPRVTANVTVEHLRIVGGGRGGSEVE